MNIMTMIENFITEQDDEMDDDKKNIQIFYNDLDIDGKKKVLDAIDASYDYINVYDDDIVRNNIEEALSKRPIITLTGEEIVNKMDIDL
jgi:hypothetical protein